MHAWLLLLIAIVLEVCGTTCMKLSNGFERLGPSALAFVFWGLSLAALILCLKRLDVSVAYAIWAGLGTVLVVGIGAVWFREPLTPARLAFIAMIVIGVIGLQLVSHG